jgi:hypothetical protein
LNSLNSLQQKQNHATINCGGNIFDRLIGNYQRLSPLAKVEVSSWHHISATFHNELEKYQSDATPSCNLAAVIEKEGILNSHSALLANTERILVPIGQYFLKDTRGAEVVEQEDSMTVFPRLLNSGPHSWSSVYALSYVPRDDMNDITSQCSRGLVALDLKPILERVSIVVTTQVLTITFEGSNLEAVVGRQLKDDTPISAEMVLFRCTNGDGFIFNPAESKLISLQTFLDRVTIKFSRVTAPNSGVIKLLTDFGESNERIFNPSDVVRGEEQAPSKAMHPTMNAEFLSSAFLRVALSCPSGLRISLTQSLKIIDPGMAHLWRLLTQLEMLLAPPSEKISFASLISNAPGDEYLKGQKDISHIRNECLQRFQEMSRCTTESFQYRESHLKRAL